MSLDYPTFCPDPFWNASLSWYTHNPNLSACFRSILLALVPLATASALFPFWIWHLFRHVPSRPRPLDRSSLAKFSLRLLLMFILAANAVFTFIQISPENKFRSDDIYLGSTLGFLLLTGISLCLELGRSLPSSSFQFTAWLVQLFCILPTFKLQVEILISENKQPDVGDLFKTLTLMPVVLTEFLLHCGADSKNSRGPNFSIPELAASVPQFLFFGWMNPLIHKGYKTPPLVRADLPPNPGYVRPENNVRKFLSLWERDRAGNQPDYKGNIWKVLFLVHWKRLLAAYLIGMVNCILVFVNPQILRLILQHIQSEDEETWKGVLYALLLVINSLVVTLCFNHSIRHMTIVALQLRNSLVAAVYRKSLKLSNAARREFSSGDITNYASVDSQLILDCIPFTPHLWGDPLLVLLTMTFLYLELGVSALAGVAFLLLLVPVNIWNNKKIDQYQEQLLEAKDERMKTTNEALSGIQVLKMFAWEMPFMKRISDIREREVDMLRKSSKMYAFSNCTFSCSPIVVTVMVFGMYLLIDSEHVLTAEKIFVSLSLFSILRVPLELFPVVMFDNIRIGVSLRRLGKFLNAEELDEAAVVTIHDREQEEALEFEDGEFVWDGDPSFVLRTGQRKISIKKGSLVAVVGKVGSGKSSLLSAILGDMIRRKGHLSAQGTVGYVPQQAWIQNATLKANILFGSEEKPHFYKECLTACGLLADLETLADSDQTEIGEQGINLSGGQKQRVSLARAVYADRDIYLMDDPLSAVDSHVGEHLFRCTLSSEYGLLKDKTRILVTHSISFLEHVDAIIVLEDGEIREYGSYHALMENGNKFAELVKEFGLTVPADHKILDKAPKGASDLTTKIASGLEEEHPLLGQESSSTSTGRLIEEEAAMEGRVKWKMYHAYMKVIGLKYSFILLLMFLVGQVLHVGGTAWLGLWADRNNDSESNFQPVFYLGIFCLLGFVETCVAYFRQLLLFLGCAKASKIFHDKLLFHVMRSPMSFFDTTPIGRLANRFSSDLNVLDETMPPEITDFVWCAVEVTFTLILISCVTPYFIGIMLVLLVIFGFVATYYIGTSRQLKRLESISKSPVLSHIQETLCGVSSIRAYQCQDRFMHQNEVTLSENVKCHYLVAASQFWLGTRTEALGSVVIFFTALFIVLDREAISPGMAGLSLVYAFELLGALSWMVQMACSLETNSVCLERLTEYFSAVMEAEWVKDLEEPIWRPTQGEITFNNFSTRYREGLDLVLDDVNLKIDGEEKIGICGRTGAGKSSITKALFRIIEANAGQISIDGIDIKDLGLYQLRQALTIIPQDPVLFSGSLRFNLDPLNKYSDDELWQSLELAHLKDHIEMLSNGLEYEVQERGENFSVGQRQLICLARALLRKNKILILDEATAAVDLETDALIQRTIRKEFSDCTILTIAHRLDTILDSHRIVVLSAGKIIECNSPKELLKHKESMFYELALTAGLVE